MKRGMLLAMIGLLALGWLTTVKNLIALPSEFNRLVEEGQNYEAEKLYIRAIESYEKALEYNPDSVAVQTYIATDYLAVGDESAFTGRCNAINEAHGYPVDVVKLLADFYIENERNESAISLLKNAMKYHKKDEELMLRYEKIRYTYEDLYVSADEIGLMVNDSASFVTSGRYGLMTKTGSIRIRNSNEWCGPYSSDGALAPVLKDGEFYFADTNGYRYEVPEAGDAVEALGILTDNAAPVKINGKYGYVDRAFHHLCEFIWDDATQISHGLGAVRQGEKWALIGSDFAPLGDYVYEDVKTDENGFFCNQSRAFVKQDGAYRMIDEKGENVGTEQYEDAVPFVTEQPSAVKKDGKWGFADREGKIVIEPQYENAGAFANGLAPVETSSGWGYINLENKLVIPDQFDGAKSFYKGIAPVKDGDLWSLIELNVKE